MQCFSSKISSFFYFHWHGRHHVIKLFLQKVKWVSCFHEAPPLVGSQHGDSTRLIVIIQVCEGTWITEIEQSLTILMCWI